MAGSGPIACRASPVAMTTGALGRWAGGSAPGHTVLRVGAKAEGHAGWPRTLPFSLPCPAPTFLHTRCKGARSPGREDKPPESVPLRLLQAKTKERVSVKRDLEFLGILVALSWGRPQAESPPPRPQARRKALEECCPEDRPKKDRGLGARPLSLVLKRLRSLPLPGLSLQAGHSLQGSQGIVSSLRLGHCPKGPWVHQDFVHVAGKMG